MKESKKLKLEVNELDSDLAYMGKMNQSFRASKKEYFEENTLPTLKEKYVVEEFNVGSFRIKKTEGKEFVDIYPSAGRMFIHKSKKWINLLKENIIKEVEKWLK